jgi:hypothetical protein
MRPALGLAALATLLVAGLACSARVVDVERDFTEEVERLCVDFCTMNLDCHEPPWFETYGDCEHACLHAAYVYNDTVCGHARRALLECVGSTETCELYNDANNVFAEDYTCKAEKDHFTGLDCGSSPEDPHPHGPP